jgi:hypothetical protein
MKKNIKLENVSFEISTKGCSVSYYENVEESPVISAGKIFVMRDLDDELEDDILVGTFTLLHLPQDYAWNTYRLLDDYSINTQNFAQNMFSRGGTRYKTIFSGVTYSTHQTRNFIIIQEINLNPEYRGLKIVDELIKYLDYHYKNVPLLLLACPLDVEEDKEAITKKLVKSYKRCGFRKLPGSTYMIKQNPFPEFNHFTYDDNLLRFGK